MWPFLTRKTRQFTPSRRSPWLRPHLEPLERRDLPANQVTASLWAGVLRIEGTERDDVVRLYQSPEGLMWVRGNNAADGGLADVGIQSPLGMLPTLAASQVRRVEVYGLAGDDNIDTHGGFGITVNVPVWLVGGLGNDILSSGGSHDLLDGGPGTNTLQGYGGNDLYTSRLDNILDVWDHNTIHTDAGGLFRSDDGGAWREAGEGYRQTIIDPRGHLLALHNDGTLYRMASANEANRQVIEGGIRQIDMDATGRLFALHNDGRLLASDDASGTNWRTIRTGVRFLALDAQQGVFIQDPTGQVFRSVNTTGNDWQHLDSNFDQIAIGADGRFLAYRRADNAVYVFNGSTGQLERPYRGYLDGNGTLYVLRDSDDAAFASPGGLGGTWLPIGSRLEFVVVNIGGGQQAVLFRNPGETTLFRFDRLTGRLENAADRDGALYVLLQGTVYRNGGGPWTAVGSGYTQIANAADGRLLAYRQGAGAGQGFIDTYDPRAGRLDLSYYTTTDGTGVLFTMDRTGTLFRAPTGLSGPWQHLGNGFDQIATGPDGRFLAYRRSDNAIYIYNGGTGQIERPYRGYFDTRGVLYIFEDRTDYLYASPGGLGGAWRRLVGFTRLTVQPNGQVLVESAGGAGQVSASLVGGLLRITGTENNDAISLREVGDVVRITLGGVTLFEAPLGAVLRAEVFGLGGDDNLDAGSLPVALRLEGGVGNDRLIGGRGNDELLGQEGNDWLEGGEGEDTLHGTSSAAEVDELRGDGGNEVVSGGAGTDFAHGGAGNDVIRGGGGDDKLYGNDGDDRLYGEDGKDELQGLAGYDWLEGGEGDDTLLGTTTAAEVDELRGDGGNDAISGGAGVDWAHGGPGSDTIRGGAGDDKLYGNDGDDRLYGEDGKDELQGLAGYDWLEGGEGDDTLLGTSSAAEVDELRGDGGNDTILGGAGTDFAHGGPGNDVIHGGLGNDILHGNDGGDTLYGGQGNDVLAGDGGNDWLEGDEDNDTLYGTTAASEVDELRGEEGNDLIQGGDGTDFAHGGSGSDVIHGGLGDDILHGNTGDDTLYGGQGKDVLAGDEGNDWLEGDEGDDSLSGTLAAGEVDELRGEEGNDFIQGGDGTDFAHGGSGNDTIHGGLGNDILHGNDGGDTLYGGQGNDVLAGDGGNDWLEGDEGDDNLLGTSSASEVDELRGEEGNDFIQGGDGTDFAHGGSGNDTIHGGLGDDKLYGNTGDDRLYGEAGKDELHGLEGDDWSEGGDGDDTLLGGQGNDQLEGLDGNDWLKGDEGDDRLLGGQGNDQLEGLDGNDYLRGDVGDDLLLGGQGHDELHGVEGNDYLRGDVGDDRLYGGQDNDQLHGVEGNDRLEGGDGADALHGVVGEDVLDGGAGNDTLVIDMNLDLFALSRGLPIANYSSYLDGSAGTDVINLRLDAGPFFRTFVQPVVNRVQQVTRSLQPVVDLFNREVPVLSQVGYHLTFGQLVSALGYGRNFTTFVNSVNAINQLDVGTTFSGVIDLGNFTVSSSGVSSAATNAFLTSPVADLVNRIGQTGFRFTIFADPADAVRLALGRPIDLFQYDLPTLSIPHSRWGTEIRIPTPVTFVTGVLEPYAEIKFTASASFGFDTTGILAGNLLEGFYVQNAAAQFGMWIGAKMGVSIGVSYLEVAGAGVDGRLEGTISLSLHDPNGDGRVRFSELRSSGFDVSAGIGYVVEAYFRYRKIETLLTDWKEERWLLASGSFTL